MHTGGAKISIKALLGSLVMFHIWGTWLIFQGTDVSVKMFDAVCFGIFSTLGVLSGEKTINALANLKWGVSRTEETTKTKTVQLAEGMDKNESAE